MPDIAGFRELSDLLSDPMLLVSVDGTIAAANRAMQALVPGATLVGSNLADLAVTRGDELAAYLRDCSKAPQFVPGALALRTGGADAVPFRVEGAVFRRPSGVRMVALRLFKDEAAAQQVLDLTRQVDDLSAEVARRRRAELDADAALERERRVQDRLAALAEASGRLVTAVTIGDVLGEIGALSERLIAADAYAVWRQEEGTCKWTVAWHRHLSDDFVARMLDWNEPATDDLLPEPLFVEDIAAVPLLAIRRDAYASERIASLVIIPLRIGAASYGTVVAYYHQPMKIGADDRRVAIALGNLASGALTMARLYESQERSRLAAAAAEQRATYLAKASAALSSSLDYEETLATIARLAVPQIADWCAVDIASPEGEMKRLAVAHQDPAKIDFALRLQARYPEDPSSRHGVAEVMRTAKPIMMSRIPEELMERSARDPQHLEIIRQLGLHSYICVPLVVRDRAIGVLTLVSAESRREFGDADLQLASEVAARAALAVENARAYEEIRRANRVKDDFLATLSHELRTPLNAVLGYARLIRSGALSGDKQARGLETLERNAAALNQIVEDILDVSRIVAGKIRLNVQPLDLSVVVHDAAATVAPAADAKGITLTLNLDPLAGPVSGDADRLQQVIWNLLSNAVKFTPRGGRVDVRLDRVDSSVEVTVADTGSGIDADFLPYLFERFRQADSRFAREHGGLGLGLAISRHLVEMHGGTITAASDGPGRGATFCVRLPVAAVRRDRGGFPSAAAAEPVSPLSTAMARLDGLTVLAVDDDPDSLVLISEILESAGASVATVSSAEGAIDYLERRAVPDVLLSDVGMPEVDGLELIARLRRSFRDEVRRLPAIALTAYARSEDRAAALDRGYQLHLSKPVSPPELVAAIHALAHHAGQSEGSA